MQTVDQVAWLYLMGTGRNTLSSIRERMVCIIVGEPKYGHTTRSTQAGKLQPPKLPSGRGCQR